MTLVSSERAIKYFEDKLDFTIGPIELCNMMLSGENINVIGARAGDHFAAGHIHDAINLPKNPWDDR